MLNLSIYMTKSIALKCYPTYLDVGELNSRLGWCPFDDMWPYDHAKHAHLHCGAYMVRCGGMVRCMVHMKKTLGSGWECYRAHMLPIGSPLGALDLRFALGLPMGGCTGVVIMHYVAIVHDIDVHCARCRKRSP